MILFDFSESEDFIYFGTPIPSNLRGKLSGSVGLPTLQSTFLPPSFDQPTALKKKKKGVYR